MTQYALPPTKSTTQSSLGGTGDYPGGTGTVNPVTTPPPPSSDPFTLAAAAQGATGTAAVNQQTIANRANQINPFGSSSWIQDPNTGQWTQNVQLAGAQQGALTAQENLQAGRMTGAAGLLPGALDAMGKPIDTSGFSSLYSFGAPGQVNQQAQDAVMGQLQPMMDQRRKAMETQLANQGITRGSEAWQNAQDQMARDENNMRLQGVQAGFTQGNLLNQQDINYGNYQSQQRAGELGEAQTLRSQPLSDINALTTGQGVQAPTFGQYGQAGVAAPPSYLTAAQSQYGAMLDQQNAEADRKASLYGGLYNLGGSFLGSQTGQNLLSGAGDYLSNLFGFGGPTDATAGQNQSMIDLFTRNP
jgi:hypothetical protein